MAAMRIILHGKAAGDSRVRTAVHAVRQNGHPAEVRVTWEPGDASRLTAEAVADAGFGVVQGGRIRNLGVSIGAKDRAALATGTRP